MSKIVKREEVYWTPSGEGLHYYECTRVHRFVELESTKEKELFLEKAKEIKLEQQKEYDRYVKNIEDAYAEQTKEHILYLMDFQVELDTYNKMPFAKKLFTSKPRIKHEPPILKTPKRSALHDYIDTLPIGEDVVMFYDAIIPEAYFKAIMEQGKIKSQR